MDHVRLTALHSTRSVRSAAAEAADRIVNTGGSPRAQIEAARRESIGQRVSYMPHQGAKERAKAARRAAKKAGAQ